MTASDSSYLALADSGVYEAGLSTVGNFDTVKSYCLYFNWLKPPSKLECNSNYRLTSTPFQLPFTFFYFPALMLLSPPSPPSPYRFLSSPQPTASSSSTRPLSIIIVSHTPYPSLQNYLYSPASGTSLTRSDPSPKTSAFFSTPFESPASPPASQSLTYVSKTTAVFSSPFAEQPSPLPDQQSTPREVPTSSCSLTADFFASTPFSSCPTSPPSLRCSVEVEHQANVGGRGKREWLKVGAHDEEQPDTARSVLALAYHVARR